MTTSGETAWSMTARDMIDAALQDGRILAAGEEPTAEELDVCLLRLNAMLKSWQHKANLFREESGEITVPADSPSGTLPEGIRDISSARVVISATNERQLARWERSDYQIIPNKATSGVPTAFYLSQGVSGPEMYLWPVPTEVTTIKIDYSRTGETITDATQTVDVPQDWQETVYTNLAVRIADLFGAQLSPLYIQRAEILYQQMLDSDRPDSYRFESSDYCCYG